MILQKVKHPSRGVLIALIFSALLFTSCENLFFENQITENIETKSDGTDSSDSPSEKIFKTINVTGNISLSGAYPQSVADVFTSHAELVSASTARTAFPSIPTTGITYTVTAENTATGSTESYTGEALTDDGNVTYRVAIPATETEKNYKVKVTAIYDSKEILSGESEEFPVSMANPVASKNIVLGAAQSTAGSGSFALEISIASDSGIVKCNTSQNSSPVAVSDGKITLTSGPLASKAHKIDFSFYDSSDNLLYKFTETINIFDNLITNTWVQNGSEPWFNTTTDANGKKTTTCRITAAMVEGYALTDIYVDSGRQATNPAEPGYTTQSGTWLNPKLSFNDALSMLHNAGKDYTIYINGELRGAQTIPSDLSKDASDITKPYHARSLTIRGATGLDASGQPQDGIRGYADELEYDFSQITNYDELRDAGKTGSALTVSTDVPVRLENIKLCDSVTASGGGLKVDSGSEVTLKSGVLISGNRATGDGGGVYVNGGNFTMRGGEISANRASNLGGGVAASSSSISMEGGKITGNFCDGLNDAGSNCGNGGGVYTDLSFTMTGGEISGNSSNDNSGGVLVQGGEFIMTGGKIENNESQGPVGGINVSETATFKLGGNAYIPYGTGNGVRAGQITVTSSLTRHNSEDKIKFVPNEDQLGQQYIFAESGVTLSNEVPKFECNHPDFKCFDSGRVARQVFYISSIGNNSGYASEKTPLATIDELFARVNKQYSDNGLNAAIDFTMVVKGSVSSLGTGLSFPDERLNSMLIRGYNDNPTITFDGTTFGGITDKLVSNGENSVLNITMNTPVTIRNLMITGGGGEGNTGIYITTGSLTLDRGTVICGNTAHVPYTGGWGGGLHARGNAEITMNSGAYISRNLCDGLGGGVALDGGGAPEGGGAPDGGPTFIMNGGEISYNHHDMYDGGGGAVYIHPDSRFIMNDGSINNNWLANTSGPADGVAICLGAGAVLENCWQHNGGELNNSIPDGHWEIFTRH